MAQMLAVKKDGIYTQFDKAWHSTLADQPERTESWILLGMDMAAQAPLC